MSVLIFVDWIPQFIGASCPHSLGTDMGATKSRLSGTLNVHGLAARSLTAAALRRLSKNKSHAVVA